MGVKKNTQKNVSFRFVSGRNVIVRSGRSSPLRVLVSVCLPSTPCRVDSSYYSLSCCGHEMNNTQYSQCTHKNQGRKESGWWGWVIPFWFFVPFFSLVVVVVVAAVVVVVVVLLLPLLQTSIKPTCQPANNTGIRNINGRNRYPSSGQLTLRHCLSHLVIVFIITTSLYVFYLFVQLVCLCVCVCVCVCVHARFVPGLIKLWDHFPKPAQSSNAMMKSHHTNLRSRQVMQTTKSLIGGMAHTFQTGS